MWLLVLGIYFRPRLASLACGDYLCGMERLLGLLTRDFVLGIGVLVMQAFVFG
jgi:hypothetical protein